MIFCSRSPNRLSPGPEVLVENEATTERGRQSASGGASDQGPQKWLSRIPLAFPLEVSPGSKNLGGAFLKVYFLKQVILRITRGELYRLLWCSTQVTWPQGRGTQFIPQLKEVLEADGFQGSHLSIFKNFPKPQRVTLAKGSPHPKTGQGMTHSKGLFQLPMRSAKAFVVAALQFTSSLCTNGCLDWWRHFWRKSHRDKSD